MAIDSAADPPSCARSCAGECGGITRECLVKISLVPTENCALAVSLLATARGQRKIPEIQSEIKHVHSVFCQNTKNAYVLACRRFLAKQKVGRGRGRTSKK